jgi:uncharacterized protein
MDRENLIEIARRAMAGRKPSPTRERGYIFNHGLRVAAIALKLQELTDSDGSIDEDVLYAGALFHDLAKGIPPHADIGSEWVTSLLRKACLQEEIAEIARLVRQHNKRNGKTADLAAKIVQDADILDKVGAQMAWRAFHFSAFEDRSPKETADYYFGKEHQEYLRTMRASLNLKVSRKAFARRHAIDESFFVRFSEELDGAL